MVFTIVPISTTPTISFLVFSVIIAFLSYYLTSREKQNNGNFFKSLLNIAEVNFFVYLNAILSVIASVSIVLLATRKLNAQSVIVIIIMAWLFYLLLSSARSSGLNLSVPSVGYPVPPQLGLGAVSLQNHYPNPVGYGIH